MTAVWPQTLPRQSEPLLYCLTGVWWIHLVLLVPVISYLMTALFLQTLHNGLLSQDAVSAELDFVHCGSDPPPEMEKISLLLGLQGMFEFLMLITLGGPNLSCCVYSCQTQCCPPQGKWGKQDNFRSISSFYPFMNCVKLYHRDDALHGHWECCVCVAGCLVEGHKRMWAGSLGFRNYTFLQWWKVTK